MVASWTALHLLIFWGDSYKSAVRCKSGRRSRRLLLRRLQLRLFETKGIKSRTTNRFLCRDTFSPEPAGHLENSHDSSIG